MKLLLGKTMHLQKRRTLWFRLNCAWKRAAKTKTRQHPKLCEVGQLSVQETDNGVSDGSETTPAMPEATALQQSRRTQTTPQQKAQEVSFYFVAKGRDMDPAIRGNATFDPRFRKR